MAVIDEQAQETIDGIEAVLYRCWNRDFLEEMLGDFSAYTGTEDYAAAYFRILWTTNWMIGADELTRDLQIRINAALYCCDDEAMLDSTLKVLLAETR